MMSINVQLNTFLNWNVAHNFGCDVKKQDDGKRIVHKVWCKLCAKYSDKITADPRIRGKAKSDIMKFISGTNFVTKHTVTRHLASTVSIKFQITKVLHIHS
jgi:hypothetical protein